MQIHQVKKLKSKKRSNRSHCNSKKQLQEKKKEYKVYVIKDTEDISNNKIQEIIAGQGAVTEGTITPEADGTYTTYIKKDATTIELTDKSTISIFKSKYRRKQRNKRNKHNNNKYGKCSRKTNNSKNNLN